jgi:PhzF family phenazine biosynthesis protein
MTLKLAQVDAFTDRAFAGNPAGVCVLNEKVDNAWMQNLAKEMNLAETAFLLKEDSGYNLRWFTPAAEVALCGHATLATAHIMWEWNILRHDENAEFSSLSGPLFARRMGDLIELDFPSEPAARTSTYPRVLLSALGVRVGQVLEVLQNRFDYMVVMNSEQGVQDVKPDFTELKQVDTRGIIVTARSESSPKADFVSRFFAPRLAIDEDPVTGSAHCCLAPYWSERLGRDQLVGYQSSARGGTVRTHVKDSRVYLQGHAVTVFTAVLSGEAAPKRSIDKLFVKG